jgi:TRAP-type C4-dicarboxylate transport system permease small subunit
MESFLGKYGNLLQRIGRIERALGISLLVIITGAIFAQVVSRYFFGLPLVWVEELSTYAFLWLVFVGASLGLKKKRHITIISFVSRWPAGRQHLFRALVSGAIAVFCLILAANGFKAMTLFEWHQRTIALPVELPRYLFYSTPLILGTSSMVFTSIHDFLESVLSRRESGIDGKRAG